MRITLICFGLFLMACGNRTKMPDNMLPVNADGCVDIDVDTSPPLNKFTDLIEDFKFVPIETDTAHHIGYIDKIIVYDSSYYVLDEKISRNLWRIDREGKFVNSIGRVGRGAGEYLEPTDFIVNSSGVIVLDHYSRRLLFYDHNGNFKSKQDLQHILCEITGMADESLIFAVAGDNRQDKTVVHSEFLIINTKGEVVSHGLKNKNKMNYSGGYQSFLCGDKVIYSRPMHNTVYSIGADSIQRQFKINIKGSPLPENYEEVCSGDFERFMNKYEHKYNYFTGRLIETNDHVLLISECMEFPYVWTVYNKNTGEAISGPIQVSPNNGLFLKDMIVMGINERLSISGNEIIGCLNAEYLMVGDDSDDYSEVLKGLNEYSNPVIFHIKLKQ